MKLKCEDSASSNLTLRKISVNVGFSLRLLGNSNASSLQYSFISLLPSSKINTFYFTINIT